MNQNRQDKKERGKMGQDRGRMEENKRRGRQQQAEEQQRRQQGGDWGTDQQQGDVGRKPGMDRDRDYDPDGDRFGKQ